jgi:hypothetical protein
MGGVGVQSTLAPFDGISKSVTLTGSRLVLQDAGGSKKDDCTITVVGVLPGQIIIVRNENAVAHVNIAVGKGTGKATIAKQSTAELFVLDADTLQRVTADAQ